MNYHLTSTAAIAAALIPGHTAISWRLIFLSWNTGDSLDLVFGPHAESVAPENQPNLTGSMCCLS